MTEPTDKDDSDYAGVNPLSDDKELEDQEGPEASTVDSGGGPNDAEDPAPDASPADEHP